MSLVFFYIEEKRGGGEKRKILLNLYADTRQITCSKEKRRD